METERQIDANRRNASRSTGPHTQERKAASSMNASSHGLAATSILLPGEDPKRFAELLADLRTQYQPMSMALNAETERLAVLLWRRERIARIEAGLLSMDMIDQEKQPLAWQSDVNERLLALLYTSDSVDYDGTTDDAEEEVDPEMKKQIDELERESETVSRKLEAVSAKQGDNRMAKAFKEQIGDRGCALTMLWEYETKIDRSIKSSYDRIEMLRRLSGNGNKAQVIDMKPVAAA